jgi:hypothetical protein
MATAALPSFIHRQRCLPVFVCAGAVREHWRACYGARRGCQARALRALTNFDLGTPPGRTVKDLAGHFTTIPGADGIGSG